jgi:hypothetical protein
LESSSIDFISAYIHCSPSVDWVSTVVSNTPVDCAPADRSSTDGLSADDNDVNVLADGSSSDDIDTSSADQITDRSLAEDADTSVDRLADRCLADDASAPPLHPNKKDARK